MPRLVRRQPLADRIKAYLNPLDFLLWLSEEVDSNDWDELQRSYATPFGLACNLVFLIARSNSGAGAGESASADVFGDQDGARGFLSWFASFLVHFLTLLSLVNAFYTFYRTRQYRLFESSVDAPPSTPSAQRVRVQSSPMSSSPLRFLSRMIATSTAESRSHPDATRDVWELAVWDPLPLCIRLFCLFSPGHVLVYMLFLPTEPHDPRPSTTVLTTFVLGVLLSVQLLMLQASYSQQTKDTAVIHKEVLHEYDVKYVHPRTNIPVRDVGTQYDARSGRQNSNVDTYVPTAITNRGFWTNPNPNYATHIDPDGVSDVGQNSVSRSVSTGAMMPFQTPSYAREFSPVRTPALKQPQFRSSTSGDGGSLGVYSHANSPLRKAASSNVSGRSSHPEASGLSRGINLGGQRGGPGRPRSPAKREGSPLKRSSVPGAGLAELMHEQRFARPAAGGGHRRDSDYL